MLDLQRVQTVDDNDVQGNSFLRSNIPTEQQNSHFGQQFQGDLFSDYGQDWKAEEVHNTLHVKSLEQQWLNTFPFAIWFFL